MQYASTITMKKYKIMIAIIIFLLFVPIISIKAISFTPKEQEVIKKAQGGIVEAESGSLFLKMIVGGEGGAYETENIAGNSLIDLIGIITLSLISLLGVFFVIKMIYAGYLWMTASGNEEQVTKARGMITNSIIGLVIVLSAFSISWFVLKKLASSTTESQEINSAENGNKTADPYDYTQAETTPQAGMIYNGYQWIKSKF